MRSYFRIGSGFVHVLAAASLLGWAGAASVYGQAATAPAAVAPAVAGDAKPVISVDNVVHDFGSVWVGGMLEHTFKISNTGNADLEILQVRPVCGCTLAGQYPKLIKPGETGDLPFRLNTQQVHNAYNKTISVTTNDPVRPQVTLALKGEVKRHVEVMPTGAFFGSVYGDTPQTRTIKLTNRTEKKLKLALDPYVTEEGPFRFELKEIEPGQVFELVVTTAPPYPVPSTQRVTAAILTNVEALRQIQVTAMASVQDRVALMPTTLTIATPATQPAGTAATPGRQMVRVTNHGQTPVKVTEATADDPALKVSVQEQTPGKLYLVMVEIPAGYVVPDAGRKLSILTDDAERPMLEVPIQKGTTPSPAATPPTRTASKLRPAELLVGQKAPTFDLTTLTGKPVSSSSLNGSVAVLNFFAPNCGFCKKQMPRLEALRADYEAKGVRFFYVSETMRKPFTQDEIVKVLTDVGVKGEVAIDPDNKVGSQFRASGFPTMTIVGKDGSIEAVNVGNRADLEVRVKAQLDALLEGKPIPAEHLPPKEPQASGG